MIENSRVPGSTPVRDIWHIPRVMVFLAVADTGSITQAARKLSLSKGVVSSHLKQLEQVCGARLFERSTRKVVLTQAGAAFLPSALAIRRAWQEGLEVLESQTAEPAGTLVLTCPSLLARSPVAEVIRAYVESYPKVRVELRVTDDTLDVVGEGIDIALRSGQLPDSVLVARRLGTMTEIIVAASKLSAGRAPPSRPEQLSSWPWLRHTVFPARRTFYGPEGQQRAVEFDASVEVDEATSLRELVVAGLGLAVLPAATVRQELAAKQLVRVLPEWTAAEVPLFAVLPSKEHQAPRVARFVELLAAQVRALELGPLPARAGHS